MYTYQYEANVIHDQGQPVGDPAGPNAWASKAVETPPGNGVVRAKEPLTLGVLRTPAGEFELASGWNGYGALMPKGAPGFDIVTRTHVEGQAAALMQRQGMSEGILYINNAEVCGPCIRYLPRMLQPGKSIEIVLPNGERVRFVGSAK